MLRTLIATDVRPLGRSLAAGTVERSGHARGAAEHINVARAPAAGKSEPGLALHRARVDQGRVGRGSRVVGPPPQDSAEHGVLGGAAGRTAEASTDDFGARGLTVPRHGGHRVSPLRRDQYG